MLYPGIVSLKMAFEYELKHGSTIILIDKATGRVDLYETTCSFTEARLAIRTWWFRSILFECNWEITPSNGRQDIVWQIQFSP